MKGNRLFAGDARILLIRHRGILLLSLSSKSKVLRMAKKAAVKKAPRAVKPLTNKEIEHLTSEALSRPSKLTAEEIRKIGGALLERTRKT
jgi:hypothetical protein